MTNLKVQEGSYKEARFGSMPQSTRWWGNYTSSTFSSGGMSKGKPVMTPEVMLQPRIEHSVKGWGWVILEERASRGTTAPGSGWPGRYVGGIVTQQLFLEVHY